VGKAPLSGYVKPPDLLPGFPRAVKIRPKTVVSGYKRRRRWLDQASGRLLEWDYQHGMVEVYDSRGNHIGEFDPHTGEQTKPQDNTRSIDP
jgi:hypothetical protein